MTVSTSDNTKLYTGDGVTTAFSFPYLVYDATHLTIKINGTPTSAWTAATYGASAGVTVTFTAAPANGAAITIQRIVPLTQATDLENFDGNPSDVTEKQFDLLVMADQQLDEMVDRSIKIPIGTTLTSNDVSGTIDGTSRVLTVTTAGPAVGPSTANIDTLAAIASNITTVASNIASVNTDASNIASINTVAGIAANVTTVAGIAANVTTVAGNDANVTTVATNIADVNTVAGISSDVTAVAAVDTETTTVAGIAANVTTVAGVAANVTTVAGIAANVTTVAGISSDVTTVATNITDVQNAEENANIAKAAAGFTYTYDSTTAAADPGSGKVRFNNATLSSATAMYISETTGLSQAIASEIATWDDSTSTVHTKLRFFKQSDPSVFAIFNVTGTNTDNGTWDTLTVAYVAGSGSIVNTDVLTVQPIRNGDKGDTGAAGSLQVANGAGTVDAITADFTPDVTLSDNAIITVVSTGANTVTNPTLNVDGTGALTIKARGNAALVAGDTGAAGYTMILRYEATGTYWELLNPAKVVGVAWSGDSGGTADAFTLTPSTPLSAYVAGDTRTFRNLVGNNTTAVTVNVSGLGTRNVKKVAASNTVVNLTANDIMYADIITMVDDGTQYILQTRQPNSAVVSVASASTTNLSNATSDYINITGTTTITQFTLATGKQYTLKFAGALTLTYGANMILPGGASITTAAGDTAVIRAEGAGATTNTARFISYTRADGTSVVNTAAPVIDIQTFTGSGTWTKPSGTPKMVLVQIWGGGASGAARATTGRSGGGGGGAYNCEWFLPATLGATETVTIGAGGVGVSGNTNGNVGGNSTFGSWLTGYGGGGGSTAAAASGAFGGCGGGKNSAGTLQNQGNSTSSTRYGDPSSAGAPAEGHYNWDSTNTINYYFPPSLTAGGGVITGGKAINGGGNGGGAAAFSINAESSVNGGGGGQRGDEASAASGGNSVNGGAGGGGCSSTTGGTRTGGTSLNGGNGGAGGAYTGGNGTSGSQPAGGGGGAVQGGTSGAGGDGKCVVTTFY